MVSFRRVSFSFPHRLSSSLSGFLPTSGIPAFLIGSFIPLLFPLNQRPFCFPHRLSSSLGGFLPTSSLPAFLTGSPHPLVVSSRPQPSSFLHRLASSLCGFLPISDFPAFLTGSPHPSVVSCRPTAFPLSSHALLFPFWFRPDQWPSRFPHRLSSSLCGFLPTSGLPAFLTHSPHPFVVSS